MAEMIKFRVGIGAQLNAKDIENQLKAQKSEVMEQVRKSLERGEKPKIDFGFDIAKDSGISDADIKKLKGQCEKQVNSLIEQIMGTFGEQMSSSITKELTNTISDLFDKLGETMVNSFESMRKNVVADLSGKPIEINAGDIVDVKTDKGKIATQVKKVISDNVKTINKEAEKAYGQLFEGKLEFDGKSFSKSYVEKLRGDEKDLSKISKNFFSTVEKVAQAYKEAKARQKAIGETGFVQIDMGDPDEVDIYKELYERVKKSGKNLKVETKSIKEEFEADIANIDDAIKVASKSKSFDTFAANFNNLSNDLMLNNEQINQQVTDLQKILARLEYAYQNKWVYGNEVRSIFDMKKYFGVDVEELRSESQKLINEDGRTAIALQEAVKSGELFDKETDLMNFDVKTLRKNLLKAIRTIRNNIDPVEIPFVPEPESVGNFAETLLNKVHGVFEEGIPVKAKLINEDELREQLEGISGLNINVNANVNGVTQSGDVAITPTPSSNQSGGIRRVSEDDILASIPAEDLMNAMDDGMYEMYDEMAKVNAELEESIENTSQMAKETDVVVDASTRVEKKTKEVKKTVSEIADILLKNAGVENISTVNAPLEEAKEELEILQNIHDLRRKTSKIPVTKEEKELLYEDVVSDRKLNEKETKRLAEVRRKISEAENLINELAKKAKSKTNTEDDSKLYKNTWKELRELKKEEESLIHVHTKRKRELTDEQKIQLKTFEEERQNRKKLVEQWHELSNAIKPASTAVKEYESIQSKLTQKQEYENKLNNGLYLQPDEQQKYDELKTQNLEEALATQEKVVESAKQELEVRKKIYDLFSGRSVNALISAYQMTNDESLSDSNVIKQAELAIQSISSRTSNYSTQYEKSYVKSIESSNSALKNQLHSLDSSEKKWKYISELVSKHGVAGAISYLENKTADLDKALGRVNNRIVAKRLSGADYAEDEGLRNTLQSQKKANGYYLSELISLTRNASSEEIVQQQIESFKKEAISEKENFQQLISTTKGKNQALDDLRHKDIKSHKDYLNAKESLERLSGANKSYQKQIEEKTLEYSSLRFDELMKRAKKIASEQKNSSEAIKEVQNKNTKQELASYIASNEVYSGSEDASNIRASLERKKKQIQNYEADMNEIIMLINRIAENPTGENVTAYRNSLETLIQRAGVSEVDVEGFKKYQEWLAKQKSQNAKKSNTDIPKVDIKDYEKGTSSIQEVINNLDKDIKDIEDKNAKLNSSLSQMTETATKIRDKITENVNAEVKTIDDDIAILKSEISKLNDSIKEASDPLEEQILREEKGKLSAKLTHKERLKNEYDREREIDRIYEKDNKRLIQNINLAETELYINNQKLEQLKAIREEQENIRKEQEPTVADVDEQKKQSTKDYSAQKKTLTNQLADLQSKLVEKEEEFTSTTLSESEKNIDALRGRFEAEQKVLNEILAKYEEVGDGTVLSKITANVGGIESKYKEEYQKYLSSAADEASAQKINQQRTIDAQKELNSLVDKYGLQNEESLKSEVEKQIAVTKLLDLYEKINAEQKKTVVNNDLLKSYVSEMESIASGFGIEPGKMTKLGQSYEYKFREGYKSNLSAIHSGALSKLPIGDLESLLSQIQKLTSGEQSVVTNADVYNNLSQEDAKTIRDDLEKIRQKYVEILKAKLEEQKVGLDSSNIEEQNQALVNTLKLANELTSVVGSPKKSNSILSEYGIDGSTLQRARDLINAQNAAEKDRARNQKDYDTQKEAELSRQRAILAHINEQIKGEERKLDIERQQLQELREAVEAKQAEIEALEKSHRAELKSFNDKKKVITNAGQSPIAPIETPVSSDTAAVEKVKENLKETEVQAEKTEQAVREAVNVTSNESTLSKEKEQIAGVTAEVQKQEQAVEELVGAREKLDVHTLTEEQKAAIGKVLNDVDASKSSTYVSESEDIAKELVRLNEEFDGQLVQLIRDKCQSVLEYAKKSTNKDERATNKQWLDHMRQSIIPTVEATLAYQGLSPELQQKVNERDNDLDAVIKTWVLTKLNGILESEALFSQGKNVTGIQIGGKDFSKASADKYDTWFQAHADGMGVFSPSDFSRLESDWKKGLRKFQLLVDGSLHEIDFSGIKKAPKTLAKQFVKEYEDEYARLTKGVTDVNDLVQKKNQAFINVINKDHFAEIKYTIQENYIDTMKKAGEVAEQVSEQIKQGNKKVKTSVNETTSIVDNASPSSPLPSSSPSVPTNVNITGISNTSGLATEAMQKEILGAINGTIKVTGDVNITGGKINISNTGDVQPNNASTITAVQDSKNATKEAALTQEQFVNSTVESEKAITNLGEVNSAVAKAIKRDAEILGSAVDVYEQMRLAPGKKDSDEKLPLMSYRVVGETGNSITYDPHGGQLNRTIKQVDELSKKKQRNRKEAKAAAENEKREAKALLDLEKECEAQLKRINAQIDKDRTKVSNDSYALSGKWLKEIYLYEEKIARAKETNSKKELEKIPYYQAQINGLRELIDTEREYRTENALNLGGKDSDLNTKELQYQNEYKTKRDAYNDSLEETIRLLYEEAAAENAAYDAKKANQKLQQDWNDAIAENKRFDREKAKREKEEQDILNQSIKEYQQRLKEIQALDKSNRNAREKNANVILQEEIESVKKLAKLHAELKTREGQGRDVSVVKEKIALEQKYLKLLKEEMLYYSDTEAGRSSYGVLKNVGFESSLNVKQAYKDAEQTKSANHESKIRNERLKEYNSLLTEAEENLKQMYKMLADIAQINDPTNLVSQMKGNAVADLIKSYNIIIAKIKTYNDIVEDVDGDLKKIEDRIEHTAQGSDKINIAVAKIVENLITATQKKIGNYKSRLIGIQALGENANIKIPQKLTDEMEYIVELVKSIYVYIEKIRDEDLFDDQNQIGVYVGEIEKLHEAIEKSFNLIAKSSDHKILKDTAITKMDVKLADWLKENTKASKYRDTIIKLREDLKNVSSGADLEDIAINFNKAAAGAKDANKEGKNFFDLMITKSKHLTANFMAQWFSLMDIVRYIRQISATVIELDTAMTELKKVSSATLSEIDRSFDDMAESAKEYGSTVADMINATADWSRMGYNLEDSKILAEVSVLYKNVGDGIDIDSANESLVSTLQGYQLDASEAIDIVDKFNEVANNFAIDSAGIGEALQRSAASFNAANTDLSKSIALVTATNEVVQNPESVGTLWKTMSARIRGASTELEELGEETDDYTESTSKLQGLIKGLTGFDILEEDGQTFKDIYEIILGIGEEWENLTDIEQASLGEALAGKRNANALYAVLGNLDTLEEAYQTAEESAGSALAEQERYEQSVQYSIDRMKASLESLAEEFLDSNLLKGVIDFGNTAINVVENVLEKFGALPTLAAAIGSGFGVFKLVQGKGIFKSKKDLLREIADNTSQKVNTEAVEENTKEVNENSTARGVNANVIDFQTKKVKENTVAELANVGADEANVITTSKSTKAETRETFAFNTNTGSVIKNTAAKAANLALAHPLATVIGVVCVAAVGALTYAIYRQTHAEELLIKKNNKLNSSIKTTVDEISSIKSEFSKTSKSVNDIAEEFAELSQGVDSISGKNVSLSTDDYERFKELGNELLSIFPNLSHVYNENGEALVTLSGNTDTIVQSLQNLVDVQKELANEQILEKAPDLFDDVQENSEAYLDRIELKEKEIQNLTDTLNSLNSDNFNIGLNGNVLEFTLSPDSDITAQFKEVTKLLEDNGIAFQYADIGQGHTGYTEEGLFNSLIIEDVEKAKALLDNAPSTLKAHLQSSISKLQSEISQLENENKSNWTSLSSSIVASLDDNDTYKTMSDQGQAMIQQLINGIDFSKIEFDSFEDLVSHIEDNLIDVLNGEHGDEIQGAITSAFSFKDKLDAGDLGVSDYLEQIDALTAELRELGVSEDIIKSITILIDYDSIKESQDRLRNSVKEIARGQFTDYYSLTEATKDLTESEIELWLEVTSGAKNAEDALNKFAEAQKSVVAEVSFDDIFALEDAKGDITPLGEASKAVDELQEAYKGLKEAMDSYNTTGHFTVDQVQSIISYGGDYLKYLMDENGNLQLNEEALNKVAVARLNEMRIKALSNLMDQLDKITSETTALSYLETQLYETAKGYDELTEGRISAWLSNIETSDITDGTKASILDSFRDQATAINEMFDNINVKSFWDSSSSSAKDASEDIKESIESYMSYMEASLNTSKIDYQTYSREVAAFLKDMFDKGKISAEDYHNYVKQMLETQQSAMDKVVSAVTRRIDLEIESYEKQKEEVEERYQKEIDYLDTVIEQHEKEKQELQDANDERDRQVALEKALYNQRRAETQRVNKLYTGEKGYNYVADSDAIRDSADEVQKAKLDIEIAKIDESIKKVKQQQEELQKAMEKEVEQLDEIIKRLTEYRDQWSEVAEQYEIQQNELMAAQILGAGWEKDILDGRLDVLNNFKDEYIAIQEAIAEATYEAAKANYGESGSDSGTTSGNPETNTVEHGTRYNVESERGAVVASYDAPYGKGVDDEARAKADAKAEEEFRRSGELYKVVPKAYAKGGKNLKKQIAWTNEYDDEAILSPTRNAILTPIKAGDSVLNPEMTKNLWKWAEINPNMFNPLVKSMDYNNIPIRNDVQPLTISIGDIQLYGVQDVNDLGCQIVKRLPNVMLQAINKR